MFKVNEKYSRFDVLETLDLPKKRGGPWFTGMAEHNGSHFIFCNVGMAGRTGHDYTNYFEGGDLNWQGKTDSRLSHPSIQRLISTDSAVHIFYRESDREDFTYAGRAKAIHSRDTSPVEITWSFRDDDAAHPEYLPEEVLHDATLREGSIKRIFVNAYERNAAARAKCIAHHGYTCSVCLFNFEETYGPLGHGYIQVHHLRPISTIGADYEIDPVKELIPVCANCHAMIHRRKEALSLEDLRKQIKAPPNVKLERTD